MPRHGNVNSLVDNKGDYHFYNSKSGLIKSRDVVFLKTTNVVVPFE